MKRPATLLCFTNRGLGDRTACGARAGSRAGSLVCEIRPDRPVGCFGCLAALPRLLVIRTERGGSIKLPLHE